MSISSNVGARRCPPPVRRCRRLARSNAQSRLGRGPRPERKRGLSFASRVDPGGGRSRLGNVHCHMEYCARFGRTQYTSPTSQRTCIRRTIVPSLTLHFATLFAETAAHTSAAWVGPASSGSSRPPRAGRAPQRLSFCASVWWSSPCRFMHRRQLNPSGRRCITATWSFPPT